MSGGRQLNSLITGGESGFVLGPRGENWALRKSSSGNLLAEYGSCGLEACLKLFLQQKEAAHFMQS